VIRFFLLGKLAPVRALRLRIPNLRPDLLIIDDTGLKNLPRHGGEHLFEIIMRRFELRSTFMTSTPWKTGVF
jgi:hypothetical protein